MYGLSTADLDIQARARRLADELIPSEVEAEMNNGDLSPETISAHQKLAHELGLVATNMPAEFGGGGCSMLQQVLVQEQMGRVTNALGWVAATPPSWFPPVATPEQIERYVIPAISGEKEECYAITEEGSGSDVDSLEATVRRATATVMSSTGPSGTSRRTTRPPTPSSKECWPEAATPASTRW